MLGIELVECCEYSTYQAFKGYYVLGSYPLQFTPLYIAVRNDMCTHIICKHLATMDNPAEGSWVGEIGVLQVSFQENCSWEFLGKLHRHTVAISCTAKSCLEYPLGFRLV